MDTTGILHDSKYCQLIISILVQRAGGKVVITEEEANKMKGLILQETGEDSTLTLEVIRLVPSPSSLN